MKVISIRLVSTDKPLRAIVDLEIEGLIIREWRIVMNGKLVIEPPRHSWRDQESGEIKYKTLVTAPSEIKRVIDGEVIRIYRRELEAAYERTRKRQG